MRLVADEELLLERTELSAGQVAVNATGGLSHLAVREHHCRGHKLGNALRLDHHPAIRLWHYRRRPEVLGFLLLVPAEAIRMANEPANRQMLQAAGPIPRSLVVGVEHIAIRIETDPTRGTDSACCGDECAVLAHLAGPAAKLTIAVKRACQTESKPKIAILVETRSKGVFVIVSIDFPAIADNLEHVRLAVIVGVLDPADIGSMSHIQPTVLLRQPKDLVKSVSKAAKFRIIGIGREGVVDHPD